MSGYFKAEEILRSTGGSFDPRFAVPDAGQPAVSVSTDTRSIEPGEGFFAFAGEKYDAHDHLNEAVEKDASILVVADPTKTPAGYSGVVIIVEDTLRAYQDLAAYYLDKVDPYVIAVTGSVGKTTLKDMIFCLVKDDLNTVATQENLNNQIGVPKTILGMPEDTEVLVLEMGMGGPGEIRRLAEIARPNTAAITNIGISHRECFDSDDGIMFEKLAIASQMKSGDRLVIDRENHEALTRHARADSDEKGYNLIEVSSKATDKAPCMADFCYGPVYFDSDALATSFEIESGDTAERFLVPVPGDYVAASSALACAAVAKLGVDLGTAVNGLKSLARTPHRLQPIKKDGILVIDDTYNASPDSMKSGLAFLKSVSASRRIAVLADMNELGPESDALHREIGRGIGKDIATGCMHSLICFGKKAAAIAEGAAETAGSEIVAVGRIRAYDDQTELIKLALEEKETGDAYLVKGSHSMHMEIVADALLGQY